MAASTSSNTCIYCGASTYSPRARCANIKQESYRPRAYHAVMVVLESGAMNGLRGQSLRDHASATIRAEDRAYQVAEAQAELEQRRAAADALEHKRERDRTNNILRRHGYRWVRTLVGDPTDPRDYTGTWDAWENNDATWSETRWALVQSCK
jgi:hypothetical protein